MGLIINEELIDAGQTVVLGLSGGPDSVCLLFELLALGALREEAHASDAASIGALREEAHASDAASIGALREEARDGDAASIGAFKIIAAHVNHGLRGDESDGDEGYVRSLCEKLAVPLEVVRIDAASLAKQTGLTIEEAGREARYAFFDELCEKHENPVIAVAHNLGDQIETILMRILRGTGTGGLAGIQQRRKSAAGYEIVRPLLGVSREEICERLEEYGETARTDSSNRNTEYLRNKLRHEAIPYLEDATGFSLRHSLLRLAENAAEDKEYFDAITAETLDEYLEYPEAERGQSPCGPQLSDKEEPSLGDTKGTSPCVAPCVACVAYLPADMLANVHPAVRHRLIRAVFAELGLGKDIAAVHLAAADRLLQTWKDGGEASGKRVEFPFDYTFGIAGKKAVFRAPAAAEPGWKPRRKR